MKPFLGDTGLASTSQFAQRQNQRGAEFVRIGHFFALYGLRVNITRESLSM